MATVTKIQPQVKRDGYYNIFVDDAFFCSLSDLQLSLLALKIGQNLSDGEKDKILESSAITKTYNRALYYLQFGPRTVSQMRTYLLRKDYNAEYIEVVLEMLIKEHYLNDELLARTFVEDRQHFKPRSRRQLQAELRKKGIGSETIEQVLSELEDNDQIEAIKILTHKKMRQTRYQDQTKMTQYLLRQGFLYSDVKQVMSELALGDNKTDNNTDYRQP